MAPSIPSAPPTRLTAGTTLQWYQAASSTPASEGWSLAVSLFGQKKLDATVTQQNGQFLVTFAATDLASYPPGPARWVARATLNGQVVEVARGTLTVELDPTAAEGDVRPTAEQLLDAIEAVLAGRIPADVQRYQIGTRQIDKIPAKELFQIRNRLRHEVALRLNGGRLPGFAAVFQRAS